MNARTCKVSWIEVDYRASALSRLQTTVYCVVDRYFLFASGGPMRHYSEDQMSGGVFALTVQGVPDVMCLRGCLVPTWDGYPFARDPLSLTCSC